MQSVSDDDVQKRILEKPRYELAAKGVFRLGRCYIFLQGIPAVTVTVTYGRAESVIFLIVGDNCYGPTQLSNEK